MANGGIIGPINDPTRGPYTTSYTSSGSYTAPGFGPGTATVLVVAGGGGGGLDAGGGGGAGGLRLISCQPVPASAVPITIGAGGGSGTSGNPSIFASASNPITSTAGGRGGGTNSYPGATGGSGGGGSAVMTVPGSASSSAGAGNTPPVSPPQGNSGGAGAFSPQPTSQGGGGGGASAAGVAGTNPGSAGPGGNGTNVSPTFGVAPQPFYQADGPNAGPSSTGIFAGGGGGATTTFPGNNGGTGGTGGGGRGGPGANTGVVGFSATANTGGGGGGGGTGGGNGGSGGSGIVIIKQTCGSPTYNVASGVWSINDAYNYKKQGTWVSTAPVSVDYLVVAGGGGGGSLNGGGGGAGGYRTSFPGGTKLTLTAVTSYSITVGAGGAASSSTSSKGSSGSDSIFSTITSSGTFAITGAGVASQYIRGDGTLANFPTSTGGGASVSYYLNGSISQGTIGGVAYKEMNSVPVIGAGTDFTINADGYIAQFITDVGDPNKLLIPGGNWNFETYFSASSGGGSPRFYIELYKYNGTTFTLIASNSATPKLINDGTSIEAYFSALAVPPTTLTVTDRLAVRFYVIHSGRTITMHTENSHLSQIITTFSSGLTALNGLTSQVQYFAVGTAGTDFNISSATDTHTFNLPTASAANRGALSSTDWSAFNGKFTLPSLTSGSVLFSNGTTIAQDNANFFWDDTNNRLGIGTTIPGDKLEVNGNVFADTFNAIGTISRYNSTGGLAVIGLLGNPYATLQAYSDSSGTGKYLALNPNGGNVGIGTTNPTHRFTSNVSAMDISADQEYPIFASVAGKGVVLGYDNSNDISVINGVHTATAWKGIALVTTGGSVGIGTVTPTTKLDVNGVITATGGNSTSWNAKQNAITLTTTGTSGPATLIGATLNIPQYSGGGGGSTPVKLTSQVLAVGSWTLVGGYYTYAFSNVNVTTNSDVSVTPQNASYLTAYNAQVLPFVGVASGVATFYSQFPPQANMTVDIVITQTT